MMESLKEIQTLLNKLERTYAGERSATIHQLQNKIWDEPEVEDEELQSLLADFASDLNFYEPVERDRDESLGYYGDEKLLQLTTAVQTKIEVYLSNS
jgi:hypothetical protein